MIGNVFAVIFFKWLCEWVWRSSKFYFAIIIQTSETRDIWRFYLEVTLVARYLLHQIFNEKSVFKGAESMALHVHVQRGGRTDSMDWYQYWEVLDLYILMGELIFKYMLRKEYSVLDKDVGDCSNQGTRKVYEYQLGLLALKLCRRQQSQMNQDLHATQTAQLSSGRFSRPALIYYSFDILQGYDVQLSNTKVFHGYKHKVKTIIIGHLKDIEVLSTVKRCKQRHS